MHAAVTRAVVVAAAASLLSACGNANGERENSQAPPPSATPADSAKPGASTQAEQQPAAVLPSTLTRAEAIRARRNYVVQVLSFDASQEFGTEAPYSDLVRLRITNKSDVVLPCLTILTKRYSNGQMVGSSRAPSIPTADLARGESVEYDYYPRGHLDVVRVDRIAVEIESIINPDSEQFFCELQKVKR